MNLTLVLLDVTVDFFGEKRVIWISEWLVGRPSNLSLRRGTLELLCRKQYTTAIFRSYAVFSALLNIGHYRHLTVVNVPIASWCRVVRLVWSITYQNYIAEQFRNLWKCCEVIRKVSGFMNENITWLIKMSFTSAYSIVNISKCLIEKLWRRYLMVYKAVWAARNILKFHISFCLNHEIVKYVKSVNNFCEQVSKFLADYLFYSN